MNALLRTFSWQEARHHPWRTATAVVAEYGANPNQFADARQFAVSLGLTPSEHSSGQQRRLGGSAPHNARTVDIAHRIESGELAGHPNNAALLLAPL